MNATSIQNYLTWLDIIRKRVTIPCLFTLARQKSATKIL